MARSARQKSKITKKRKRQRQKQAKRAHTRVVGQIRDHSGSAVRALPPPPSDPRPDIRPTRERQAKGDVVKTVDFSEGALYRVEGASVVEALFERLEISGRQLGTAHRLKAIYDQSRGAPKLSGGYQTSVGAGWEDPATLGNQAAERIINEAMRVAGHAGSNAISRVVFHDQWPRDMWNGLQALRFGLDRVRKECDLPGGQIEDVDGIGDDG